VVGVCGTVRGIARLLGYARVSTIEQNPDLQVDELTAAGCWKVWTDHASEALDRRPKLGDLEQLRPGRAGGVAAGSAGPVVAAPNRRGDRAGRAGGGVPVVAGEHRHHTTRGRLVFHLFGALGQFEREIIRDRTVAGLTAARARGRVGGRPSKLTAEQVRQARKMYDARELTVEQIGAVLGLSRTSIYRALGKTTTIPACCSASTCRSRSYLAVDTRAYPSSTGGPYRRSCSYGVFGTLLWE